ncbi:MFS transporter [Nitratidesulfovibrio sp.]|uniref:MFS transporter n=1 Tax=Nitratidesulfovibrio sp. TaxID=2802297 RepID=UPI00333FA7AC
MHATKNNSMYLFLMILTVCGAAGLQVWVILFDNFLVNSVGLTAYHAGILQSVREVPGFLSLLAVFALLVMHECRLAVLSVVCLGVGVFITGLWPSFTGLVVTTLVSSLGYHYFETARQSLTLQSFGLAETPTVLARQVSAGAATSVVVGVLVYFGAEWLSTEQLYMLFGGAIVVAALCLVAWNPTGGALRPQQKRIVLRRRYWVFYALTFMGGARRQIFIAFAAFLLVQKFQFSVREISLLFIVNNIVCYFSAPLVARLIPRLGERTVLSTEYLLLAAVFVSYGLVESRAVAICLYVLDHVLFNFSMAITTYFQKIADHEDLAPSAAAGFTINHIAAVVLPVTGGYLWMIDYRVTFFAGALMSLCSLVIAQFIRPQLTATAATTAPTAVGGTDAAAG